MIAYIQEFFVWHLRSRLPDSISFIMYIARLACQCQWDNLSPAVGLSHPDGFSATNLNLQYVTILILDDIGIREVPYLM